MSDALIGAVASLDHLFQSIRHIAPDRKNGELYYDIAPGWYPLCGLPGTVNPQSGEIVIVQPRPEVIDCLQPCMTAGVIGGFRSVRSAAFMQTDRLPVYAFDFSQTVSRLLATVPIAEHERFEGEPR